MRELILSVAYAAIFLFLIPRMPLYNGTTVRPRIFQAVFLLKLLAAFGLFAIYTWYYPDRPHADIFRYFDDSDVIVNAFRNDKMAYFRMLTGIGSEAPELSPYYDQMRNWYNTDLAFNDSRSMIRICAFLRIFSLGTYYPLVIILSFLSMTGLTGLYRSFESILPGRELPLLAGVYLLPSTLLWTSGVIKEAVLLFAAGLFLYQFLLIYRNGSVSLKRILALCFFLFFLFQIKSYFMFLLLPGISALLLFRKTEHRSFNTIAIHLTYYVLIAFALPPIITGSGLPDLLSAKQKEFIEVAQVEGAKSYIEIPRLDDSYLTLFKNMPAAFFRVLLRPHVAEADNAFMLLAGMENLVIVLFILCCLFSCTPAVLQQWKSFHWSALFLVISLFVLIGLITPILGAMVRYKVPVLPFLVFVATALPGRTWIRYKPSWLCR